MQVNRKHAIGEALANQKLAAVRVYGATVYKGRVGNIRPLLNFASSADLPDVARGGAHRAACHPKRAELVESQPHRGRRGYCEAAGLARLWIVAVDAIS